ncbi:MAG: CU044_2847 family protein [Planctomycetota bacterium]
MKRLIEFPTKGNSSILVEVDEPEPEGGMVQAARTGEIAKASQTFEAALDRIKPAAGAIIAKLRGLGESPDEIDLEFGLKLSVEAGAFIASTGTEANLKVRLNWKREKAEA